jgi:hypothetical protein
MGWFQAKPKIQKQEYTNDPTDLEYPLLFLSEQDVWRLRDACEGVQIFGATGSGKTSGSGQSLAKAYLRAGYGGLVLTVKPDERQLWERYCRDTGREDSLVIFSPSEKWRFNFLDYEMRRPGVGAGLTDNLVSLFYQVLENADRMSSDGQAADAFWGRAMKRMLRNAIELVRYGTGRLSLEDIYGVIQSAPNSLSQRDSDEWSNNSFCFHCIAAGEEREKTLGEQRDFELAAQYWLSQFPTLADKTRSIVVESFIGMADSFLRGVLNDLFCSETNLVPELTHEGVVIVLDLPVKEYGEVGRFAQVLFKLIWQKAVERRIESPSLRPVFLWADEAHNFIVSQDMSFQTTARSGRACTVYLTQNISNYYAAMDGKKGKAETDSLLACLQTKIFHQNNHPETNYWAAEVISKITKYRYSYGSSQNNSNMLGSGGNQQSSTNVTPQEEYDVPPSTFGDLKKGGPKNGLNVEGIFFQGGRSWNGKRYIKATFNQEVN